MTIADSFREIARRTLLTDADRRAYDARRADVRRCLEKSWRIADVVPFGSYARGTAVHGTSDLDLLVVLRRSEIRWGVFAKSSSHMLNLVRNALRNRFTTTHIGRDKQAVVIDFADGRSVDVVPGWWSEAGADGWPIYQIPDGFGDWIHTSPKRHAKLIVDADARADGKLSVLARILKYWCATRRVPIPISSFYVEVLAASLDIFEDEMSYAECFAALLQTLANIECAAIDDPLDVADEIRACTSAAKLETAVRAVDMASQRALRALLAEERGRVRDAARLWSLVFNGRFPRSAA